MTTSRSRPRFAVLISGRGSNLGAILDAELPAECVGVLASRASAAGLEVARAHGVPTAVVSGRDHTTREAYDAAAQAVLDGWNAEWVVLAGFMRILTEGFVQRWAGRIVNIHPSLLPAFPGLHPHQQALDAGVPHSGCTVHRVEPGDVDGGEILAQAEVPVLPDDDAATLAARILEAEHVLYPETLRTLFSEPSAR